MENQKSFFESLFDLSFTSFVTSKIIKLLYVLSIVGVALASLFFIILAFGVSTTAGVLTLLVGAPLLFFISVIYSRVLLEIVIVIFRISEHAAEIAGQGRKNIPPSPTG